MTTRTKRETLSFTVPFKLPGVEGTVPAGEYEVETEEELLEQLSFRAYHRLSTRIRIPLSDASYQSFSVDPADLEAALAAQPGASGKH